MRLALLDVPLTVLLGDVPAFLAAVPILVTVPAFLFTAVFLTDVTVVLPVVVTLFVAMLEFCVVPVLREVAVVVVRAVPNEPDVRLPLNVPPVLLPPVVVLVTFELEPPAGVYDMPLPLPAVVVLVRLPLNEPPVLLLPILGRVLPDVLLFTVTRVELFILLPLLRFVSPLFQRSRRPTWFVVPVRKLFVRGL